MDTKEQILAFNPEISEERYRLVNKTGIQILELGKYNSIVYEIQNTGGSTYNKYEVEWGYEFEATEQNEQAGKGQTDFVLGLKNKTDMNPNDRKYTFTTPGIYTIKAMVRNKETGEKEEVRYRQYVTAGGTGEKEAYEVDFANMAWNGEENLVITAKYEKGENKLSFSVHDKGSPTEQRVFLEMDASNNLKKRECPTESGKSTGVPLKTTPPWGYEPKPYIPGSFPNGNWKINAIELSGKEEYGAYKIRTNATRMVEAWEYVEKTVTNENGEKKTEKAWQKIVEDSKIKLVPDAGLLIHSGGWSGSNPLADNNYLDTTQGCIRIKNSDSAKLVTTLITYLHERKEIVLEVKE